MNMLTLLSFDINDYNKTRAEFGHDSTNVCATEQFLYDIFVAQKD